MSIFAETLPICAARVLFASATSLPTIFEILSFSHPGRVTTDRPFRDLVWDPFNGGRLSAPFETPWRV